MFANSQTKHFFKKIMVYLFSESKGCVIFPPKSLLFLLKGLQKQPYNLVIRFTLVIIIND